MNERTRHLELYKQSLYVLKLNVVVAEDETL